MKKRVLIGAMIAAVCSAAGASVSWTFDSDAEGWGTLNDAQDFTWDGSIGQPEGAIRARDQRAGDIWYFSAPVSDFGAAERFYGGEVSWDALGIQGNQTSIPGRADVMIIGGGVAVGLSVNAVPNTTDWTPWSATIDVTSADWRLMSDVNDGDLSSTNATEADVRTALANLTGFYIRGEFTNGSDQSAIDNVLVVPAPAGVAVLGLGLTTIRRRR